MQNQTNGKQKDWEPTFLDQILDGETGASKFGTLNEDTYKQRLDAMDRADLHEHATQVGVIPKSNRKQLKETLLKKFRQHVKAYTVPKTEQKKPNKLTKEEQEITKKTLAEGKGYV